MVDRWSIILIAGLVLAMLAGCGGQEQPTPTPAATPTVVPTAAPTENATLGDDLDELGKSMVRKVGKQAADRALSVGVANLTVDQMIMALSGVLYLLDDYTKGKDGKLALADCKALIPGIILRSDNKEPLQILLDACNSGDKEAISNAMVPFHAMMP